MYDIILSFITAFALTFLAIPSIINVAKTKNLVDVPDERKSHVISTPSLGGIAIFAGVIFSIVLWTPFNVFGDLQYILCAFIIIFLIGAKDDIAPMSPRNKLAGQIFASFILVFKANIKLTSLYGIFGIYHLPFIPSILLSMFTILVIINALNLIDGINGLSGSISFIICVTFGSWFYLVDRLELTIIAFSLAGALIAFLKYNFTPAKIFMGDTGSLLCGIICAILTIKFIELHNELSDLTYAISSAPAVAIGILILPLFDTIRVFTMRILKGQSPFSPDRTHIHHLLLDSGLSHMQGTAILVMVNIMFILMSFRFQDLGNERLALLILGVALLLTTLLYFLSKRAKQLKNEAV